MPVTLPLYRVAAPQFVKATVFNFCASGSVIYLWSPGGQTDSCITVMNPGHYKLQVTGANEAAAILQESILPLVFLQPQWLLSENGNCTAWRIRKCMCKSLLCTGYTYLWSNNATSACIGGLSAGTYTVTVTDSNPSCSASNSASVSTTSNPTVNCALNQLADSVTANPSGGTGPPYSYSWTYPRSRSNYAVNKHA